MITTRSMKKPEPIKPEAANPSLRIRIPPEYTPYSPFFAGLKEWEREAFVACGSFTHAKSNRLPEAMIMYAEIIGSIVTRELLKGNFAAPRVISEGLTNLRDGKPFIPEKYSEPSLDKRQVYVAFIMLRESGNPSPSQAEVRRHLAENGYAISSSNVSKIIKSLGLGALVRNGQKDRTHRPAKRNVST